MFILSRMRLRSILAFAPYIYGNVPLIVYDCITIYEWNTGAEQTGVSSINEPIMIMSNAFLHNHEAGVDTYFWETPVCRKNWDATRTYVAAPEVPHVGGDAARRRSALQELHELLRRRRRGPAQPRPGTPPAPRPRRRGRRPARGRRGKALALGDLGGRELGAHAAAASCVTQSQDICKSIYIYIYIHVYM